MATHTSTEPTHSYRQGTVRKVVLHNWLCAMNWKRPPTGSALARWQEQMSFLEGQTTILPQQSPTDNILRKISVAVMCHHQIFLSLSPSERQECTSLCTSLCPVKLSTTEWLALANSSWTEVVHITRHFQSKATWADAQFVTCASPSPADF